MAIAKQIIGDGPNLPVSPTNGGTGVSNPTAHGILIAEGSSPMVTKVLTNGQILVGSTGNDPVATSIASGTGITVTNGSGSVSVALSTPVSSTNGGTGVNNGSSTITLGGNLTTSGANALTLTTTGTTNVTLPTTGTLVNTAVTTLSSLTSVGTIGTGTWQGTVISPTYGGTGASNPTTNGVLVAKGSSAMVTKVLTNGQLLIGSTGAEPVGATLTAGTGITITNGAGSISIAGGSNNIITESTTARTLQLSDAYGYIRTTNGSATTITVPLNATVAFAIGTQIDVFQAGAGLVTFAATGGVTINAVSLTMSKQYKGATLIKVATDTWDLIIG